MAPHTDSATPEQIDTLLNFLDEHRDLAVGKLRSIEGKVQAKRLWEELCNTLNSMGGCTKIVQQWQKVWFDRKHLAKKAAADARRSATATGGGPSLAPPLSQWELKVISIMGDGFGGRQTGARVPVFSEINDEPTPSTSSQASPLPSFPQPLSLHLPEEVVESIIPIEHGQPRQMSEPASQPVSQEFKLSTRSSQQQRRRRSAAGFDVRSRLFQVEEERAGREILRNRELAGIRSELAGIKAELSQMSGLMREYINNKNK